jgi:hypothetical protein
MSVLSEAAGALTGTTEAVKGLERGIGLLDGQITNALKNITSGLLNPGTVINDTARLQDMVYEMTRETMGQTKVIGDMMTDQMAQLWYQSSEYGISLEDNFTLLQNMNNVMKVNTLLTNEQALNMGILARNAGLSTEEIATMAEAFDTIGIGTDETISNISDMQKMARQYGLNVGEFMKGISTNIKTMASYNFKDGAAGLANMVAKAQALRIDMQNSVQFAERLLDPEFAIETAASFQMIGGAVGDLEDPFALLHMAQNDIGGIQDAVIEASQSLVTMNEDTGSFEIVGGNLYKLRDMAKATGISVQELAETAIKSSERTRKIDILGSLGKYDEETQELIANLADIDSNGRVTVSLPDEEHPGVMKLYDATMLGETQLRKLTEIQNTKNLSDKEIAEQQLSASRKLATAVDEKSRAIRVVMGTSTDGVMDVLEYTRQSAQLQSEDMDVALSSENIERYGRTFTDALAKGFTDSTANELFKSAIGTITSDIVSGLEVMEGRVKERLNSDNIIKFLDVDGSVSVALNNFTKVLEGFEGELERMGIPIGGSLDLISSAIGDFGGAALGIGENLLADLQFLEQQIEIRPPVVPLPGRGSTPEDTSTEPAVVTLNGDIRFSLGDTTLSSEQTNILINALLNNAKFLEDLSKIVNGRPEGSY